MPPATRPFKTAVYGQLARIGKALASGPRLELLDLLCQGPRSVDALAEQVGHSLANTSHHLQVLRQARLVEAEREGVYVTYRLADPAIGTLLTDLRGVAESRLLEVGEITRSLRAQHGTLDSMDGETLAKRLKRGAVTLLDVRPAEEYDAGHIPKAVSLPVTELRKRLAELPRSRQVVVYCRGPYCVMALEAVALLRRRGFRAVPMREGVTDWRARGFPVAVSRAAHPPAT